MTAVTASRARISTGLRAGVLGEGGKRMAKWWRPWKRKVEEKQEELEVPLGVILEPIGHSGDGCFRVRGETLDDIERRRDPTCNYSHFHSWEDD